MALLAVAVLNGSEQLFASRYKRVLPTEEELRRIIRDAGFKPAQRDTLYRTIEPAREHFVTYLRFRDYA